jgi:hypothetical protein
MTIERRISFFGKQIRNETLKPGSCYTLEEHLIFLGPQRHVRILSNDEAELRTLDIMQQSQTPPKIFVREAMNGKINNKGDFFSRILRVDYYWKPQGK